MTTTADAYVRVKVHTPATAFAAALGQMFILIQTFPFIPEVGIVTSMLYNCPAIHVDAIT